MSGKKQFRPHSNASRLWVAAGSLWPPFSNQMVIEGSGSIEHAALEKAVEKASIANPGSRLILTGFPCRKRWTDSGIMPPVRGVDGAAWSGYDMNGAPFLSDRLNVYPGPSCEVLLIAGSKPRVCFRSHHAVMDGRGTMTWAEDVFRELRGEKPEGSEFCTIEDDLLNLSKSLEKPATDRYLSPVGRPRTGSSFRWYRIHINGRFRDILPAVMMHVAAEAWKFNDGKVRIGVPVDLRSRRNGLRSTGNLTNAIFFNIDKTTTIETLADQIRQRLDQKNDGVLTWEDNLIRFIPVSVLKHVLSCEEKKSAGTNLYRYSGIISNLGKMPLDIFSAGTFRASSVFFIPPGNGLTPLFITMQGNTEGLDIIMTIPAGSLSDKEAGLFLKRISELPGAKNAG